VVNLLVTLAVMAVVCLILMWAFQRRMMYFPFGDVPSPGEVGLPDASPVTFTTADGLTLHAWFVPSRQEPARFTVLVFNGNAGNRSFRAPLAAALRALGLNVLVFDYRGFGNNPGTPTEAGLLADARGALDYLRTRADRQRQADVDPARIVYFGESLGSGVAVALAVEHPPAALILRSPFTSMTDLGQLHYPLLPVRWLLRDRYASIDRIGQLSCPLLVIAGERDTIVPADYSRRLYDSARGAKTLLMLPGADHNDEALLAGRAMIEAIDEFLRQR
jgi:fermentation-respiration switch protein FrsA (DUF1100 family)